jgi:hypothetical protein
MPDFILALLPSLLALTLGLGFVFLVLYVYGRSKKNRRSPLSSKLLRSPGQRLIAQIEDVSEEINSEILSLFLIPMLFLTTFMPQLYLGRISLNLTTVLLVLSLLVLLMAFVARRLARHLVERNRLRLGLDAEMAVGQELNHLMRERCHVYHDFYADEFNIDHVVVGPAGVFAVETKGRSKKGQGKDAARVIYEGDQLHFPAWVTDEPLHQAKRQAQWLARWLSNAVGENVEVRPVVALPGWFVELKQRSDILVINGKKPTYLAKPQGAGMSESMVQRIAHQLEQRCRDVEPAAYKNAREAKTT